MPLPDLDILVAAIELGSLSAAAEHLAMPRATLSRRLSRLEDEVGARLVDRTARRVVPTQAGSELYRHARPILAAIDSAAAALRAQDGVPRGLLRVSIPGADDPIGPMLADFLRRYHEVRLEAVIAARHVDLVAEGFDVALRAGVELQPSLIARRLSREGVQAVASPGYLARHGRPTHPSELADHDCLVGFDRGETPSRHWPLLDGGLAAVRPRFSANDPVLLLQAALAGQGIAFLPALFTRSAVAARQLELILPDEIGIEAGIWIVYPEQRLMLPRVRAFIDHVVEWLEAHPLSAEP